jgi:GTPase SAR1 family protein
LLNWPQTLDERGNDGICVLVGNKNDLESKVPRDKVLGFARPLGIVSAETSAKTGQNVPRLFKAKLLVNWLQKLVMLRQIRFL